MKLANLVGNAPALGNPVAITTDSRQSGEQAYALFIVRD